MKPTGTHVSGLKLYAACDVRPGCIIGFHDDLDDPPMLLIANYLSFGYVDTKKVDVCVHVYLELSTGEIITQRYFSYEQQDVLVLYDPSR